MDDIQGKIRRHELAKDLRGELEATIDQRVDRYIEIFHQDIMPNNHFAEASAQCIRLYTDGYYLSAVMVTQAVAEGIRKLLVKSNGIKPDDGMDGPAIFGLLAKDEIISEQCEEAFKRIWRSFRDDLHHMNTNVATIPEKISFHELAKRNIQDLAHIEREIFACRPATGAWVPLNPCYWPVKEDGTVGIFLRCSP